MYDHVRQRVPLRLQFRQLHVALLEPALSDFQLLECELDTVLLLDDLGRPLEDESLEVFVVERVVDRDGDLAGK